MQVIVHGGAGGEPDEPETREAVIEDAANVGVAESEPIDAVTSAVGVLESSPRFNAGTGSAVQSDGAIRTDAGLMTDDRAVGAVCSMSGVERAVDVARVVLEETPHVFVSGEYAVELARAYGIETDVDLRTDRTREKWESADAPDGGLRTQLEWVRTRFGVTDPGGRSDASADERSDAPTDEPPSGDTATDHDTVGAVAFDGESLAAATSTGGRWAALAGRVGDVPQIGSGFYCTPAAGASATGAGEDIARVTLSRLVVEGVERGLDADAATTRAIEEFEELTGSTAGVVAIDAEGIVGAAYNSAAMQTATARR